MESMGCKLCNRWMPSSYGTCENCGVDVCTDCLENLGTDMWGNHKCPGCGEFEI